MAPGKAWNGWESAQPKPTHVEDLAVAPAAGGRLVVFSVGGNGGTQSLARAEQGPLGGVAWAGCEEMGIPGYNGAAPCR